MVKSAARVLLNPSIDLVHLSLHYREQNNYEKMGTRQILAHSIALRFISFAATFQTNPRQQSRIHPPPPPLVHSDFSRRGGANGRTWG